LTPEKLLERTVADGECRLWTGAANKRTGYGSVWDSGRTRQVHVVAYETFHGPIHDGLHVMHSCDRRHCIAPAHLSLGTRLQNMADMVEKGRANGPRGEAHPLAKLTAEAVEQIRQRYRRYDRENGAPALAREFGVTKGAILAVIYGITWKAPKCA
jgi:hypothetical protein